MPNIQHKRGTRAALDALASGSGLIVGQIYLITDETRIAIATSVSAYQTFALESEAGGGGADPWTYVILGSDFPTSATANTNVTGLAFAPAANKRYAVEGSFLLRTAVTTVGARPGISWPTGLTDGAMQMTAPNSNTALAFRSQQAGTTANAASTGLPAINASFLAKLDAIIITGASPAGNFQVTLASETAANEVTMRAGSFIRHREVA